MDSTTEGAGNTTTDVNIVIKSWKDLYLVVLHYVPVAIAIDRFATPVWCAIGLLGNLISVRIWVLRRMRKCNSSASYLATLAVSDLLFLLLLVPYELQYPWMLGALDLQGWCQVWNVLYMVTQYLSLLLVCAFTLERFLSVCRPFDCQRFAETSRSTKVIVGVTFISVLLSLPQALFWSVSPETNECQLRVSDITVIDLESIYQYWNWTSEVVMFGALPFIALILNICVLRQIRTVGRLFITEGATSMTRASQMHGKCMTTTMTLLWISFYLIFTKLPATIVFSMQTSITFGREMTMDAMATDSTWNEYFFYFTARKIIDEIGISHHACNIFIYCATSGKFRRHLKALCFHCLSCSGYDHPGSGRLPLSNKMHKQRL